MSEFMKILPHFKTNPKISHYSKGFTLVEIVVVLVIIGIAAAIAIPNFINWLPNYRLKAAVQDIYANIQLAKLTAIQRNRSCTIIFDTPTAGDYIVFVDNNGDAVQDVGEPVITQQILSAYPDVIALAVSTSFPGNALTFRPNAIPLAGGTVTRSNTNGRTNNVVVNLSGSVSVN